MLRVFVLFLVGSLSILGCGRVFDFLKPNKYTLSPSVSGKITKQGEPVKGLKLRLFAGFNKYYEVFTTTDDKGMFSFDKLVHSQWFKPFVLNEYRIIIEVTANFNGHDYLLWQSFSGLNLHEFVYENFASLSCDIDDIEAEYHFKNVNHVEGAPLVVHSQCDLVGYEEKY